MGVGGTHVWQERKQYTEFPIHGMDTMMMYHTATSFCFIPLSTGIPLAFPYSPGGGYCNQCGGYCNQCGGYCNQCGGSDDCLYQRPFSFGAKGRRKVHLIFHHKI